MRRREFLALLGLGALEQQRQVAAAGKPDIVVIVTDDMRDTDWQALPETQRWIEQEGTFFPNFILPTPICAPSRSSIFTGMYAHNHGVTDNEGRSGGWPGFNRAKLDDQTIAVSLRNAGYYTGLVGKYLNDAPNSGHVPPGWDNYIADGDSVPYYDFILNDNGKAHTFKQHSQYSTDVLQQKALAFVAAADTSTPMFLYFATKAPHSPSTPAPYAKGDYAGAQAGQDPSFNEADVSDKPHRVRSIPLLGKGKVKRLDRLEVKRLETLVSVDQAITALREAVASRNNPAGAAFFVLSDNGFQMGQHRLLKKNAPYRGSTQVAMGAVGPGLRRGATDRRLVANFDIPATLAEFAGASLPRQDGRSLLASAERTALVVEGFRHGGYRGLRTQRYLYVEDPKGERELYDYQNDPWELDNLLADWDGHTPTQASLDLGQTLAARLSQMKDCAGDRCRSLDTQPL